MNFLLQYVQSCESRLFAVGLLENLDGWCCFPSVKKVKKLVFVMTAKSSSHGKSAIFRAIITPPLIRYLQAK